MSWPCPVCTTPVVVDYRDTIEGALCEYADHCPNGCYESRFAYGASEERIGSRWWGWTWTESPTEEGVRQLQQVTATAEARAAFQCEGRMLVGTEVYRDWLSEQGWKP